MVEAWATALTKMGVEVMVVTNTKSTTPDQFDFEVYRQPGFFSLVRLMRNMDAIVQFNVSLKGLPAWFLSGKPLIITHHTLLVEPGQKGAWLPSLKQWVSNNLAVLNISCSQYIGSQFHQSTVIYSPYNASLFRNKQLPRQPGSLVFAGRLVTDKGVDNLLRAVAILDQRLFTNLVIAGDGPEKTKLEQLAVSLQLSHKVQFIGKVQAAQLVDLLNNAEVMIVPSLVEPFGITVLEGLACGCRMVVSKTGGLPEAAGGYATLFEKGKTDSLAAAIEQTLIGQKKMDTAGITSHLEKMTIPHTAGQFLSAIENALTSRYPSTGSG